eukprot:COSAG02_NODE_4395_length_5409_cov_3.368738_6_plen_57_part_00
MCELAGNPHPPLLAKLDKFAAISPGVFKHKRKRFTVNQEIVHVQHKLLSFQTELPE